MRDCLPPDWPTTAEAAIAVQQRLRAQVVSEDRLGPIRSVAGVDAGFRANGTITRAAVAVLSFPELALQAEAIAECATSFPYIPGLLSFREVPAVLAALAQLSTPPDVILCDGQGLAHPRRFGIACHVGVLLDRPTIGVAKTRLIGTHAPLADRRGAWQPLLDGNEVIGAVVRTRAGTRPLYVSVGHRISLPTAIRLVLQCTPRYRLPETTRRAHHLASRR
ncbi:deoxyribonuclease V [Kallotenue papyrolyticum]|uniref:deoxyribonuclease V n=1 Tax=Kallotenue papyrolyticum TaxID=1325125 RepID=UPI00047858F7|nr:deoxyribonuclease V [Kallotenue papyrolyticum]